MAVEGPGRSSGFRRNIVGTPAGQILEVRGRTYLSVGGKAGAAAADLAQRFGGEAQSLGAGGGEAPPLGAAGHQQFADGRHLGRTASFGGRLRSAAQPRAGDGGGG